MIGGRRMVATAQPQILVVRRHIDLQRVAASLCPA
jgi:hypothetical protein